MPDSISQFGPYVSKYAFYPALPTPPGGERFGTVRMQLTEHYWLANPNDFAFVPVWWEEDFKGEGRTVEDGSDYRWQFMGRIS